VGGRVKPGHDGTGFLLLTRSSAVRWGRGDAVYRYWSVLREIVIDASVLVLVQRMSRRR
jgi:hypothetical protein